MENTAVSKPIIESIIGVDAPLEIIQKFSQETLSRVVDAIFQAFEENTGATEHRHIYNSSMVQLTDYHKKGELWHDLWEVGDVVNCVILSITVVMKTQSQDF